MCPILFALLFFLLLFALFFSASVVLFVGQRQKQITKLFFRFFLLLIAISEANSMCVFVCPRKTLKKNGSRKIFISIFWRQFSSTRKHFLLKKSHIFILENDRRGVWILNWTFGDRGTHYSERYRKKNKKKISKCKCINLSKKRRELYLDMLQVAVENAEFIINI